MVDIAIIYCKDGVMLYRPDAMGGDAMYEILKGDIMHLDFANMTLEETKKALEALLA